MGSIDTNNSLYFPLVGTDTFLGTYTSTTNWAEVCISIECDSSFYLVVNFSSDGVNTGITKTANVSSSPNALIYNYPPYFRYVQVQLTNTGNDQTYLRLQTMFKSTQNYSSTSTNPSADVNIVSPVDGNGYVQVSDALLESCIYGGTANLGVIINNSATIGVNDMILEGCVAYGSTPSTANLSVIIENTSTIPVSDALLESCIYGGDTPGTLNLGVLVNNVGAISVNDSFLANITYTNGNVNVYDGNLASVINSGNVSVLVNNTSAIPVSDAYLASITYTESNVNVYDANLASVINSGNVSVLINNTNTIPVSDAYLASLTYTDSNINVYDGNLASCIVNSNVNSFITGLIYDSGSVVIAPTLVTGVVAMATASVEPPPDLTESSQNPLSTDLQGNLRVIISANASDNGLLFDNSNVAATMSKFAVVGSCFSIWGEMTSGGGNIKIYVSNSATGIFYDSGIAISYDTTHDTVPIYLQVFTGATYIGVQSDATEESLGTLWFGSRNA